MNRSIGKAGIKVHIAMPYAYQMMCDNIALLFRGAVETGKSFLDRCIASALLELEIASYLVRYFSYPRQYFASMIAVVKSAEIFGIYKNLQFTMEIFSVYVYNTKGHSLGILSYVC